MRAPQTGFDMDIPSPVLSLEPAQKYFFYLFILTPKEDKIQHFFMEVTLLGVLIGPEERPIAFVVHQGANATIGRVGAFVAAGEIFQAGSDA